MVLKTTAGDIDIELWPKEAPKVTPLMRCARRHAGCATHSRALEFWGLQRDAMLLQAVRNFVQLCLEGFYDGCAFHRVLKDFLVQASIGRSLIPPIKTVLHFYFQQCR